MAYFRLCRRNEPGAGHPASGAEPAGRGLYGTPHSGRLQYFRFEPGAAGTDEIRPDRGWGEGVLHWLAAGEDFRGGRLRPPHGEAQAHLGDSEGAGRPLCADVQLLHTQWPGARGVPGPGAGQAGPNGRGGRQMGRNPSPRKREGHLRGHGPPLLGFDGAAGQPPLPGSV